MTNLFEFGENHPDYPVRVLNEREVRGAAGIMFFFALIAFMNAWFKGDFSPTKLTIIAFFVEFFIRVVINPRYAPSLVIARFIVRNQTPEYVGAPQKRFAWSIGLFLATLMMYLVVINNVRGPINMLTCLTCLLLMFFESAFGICIGCKIYNVFNKEKAQLCPGNVCEVHDRQAIQMINAAQIIVVVLFLALIGIVATMQSTSSVPLVQPLSTADGQAKAEEERCRVPDFAKKLGHEEKWKLHNGCL
jgi:hypothetical protein